VDVIVAVSAISTAKNPSYGSHGCGSQFLVDTGRRLVVVGRGRGDVIGDGSSLGSAEGAECPSYQWQQIHKFTLSQASYPRIEQLPQIMIMDQQQSTVSEETVHPGCLGRDLSS
jgi:hypothetical protein